MSGQLHTSAALLPGKEPPVPIEQEIWWTSEERWRGENSCSHRDSNSDPLVVQPEASRYTDYAIPALLNMQKGNEFLVICLMRDFKWMAIVDVVSVSVCPFVFPPNPLSGLL
jgi:hypothetical protein